jgi:hypothetical protein
LFFPSTYTYTHHAHITHKSKRRIWEENES